MEIRPVAVATFARFYEAPGLQQERMVREARLMQADSKGYIGRDYYGAFRNALAETHWQSGDLDAFEYVLDGLVDSQKSPQRQEKYRILGERYLDFFRKHPNARLFTVPTIYATFAGLEMRVSTEIGMSYEGDDLALKLYLRAPQKPTRAFRLAIEHITHRARQGVWNPNWRSAILDLHRGVIRYPRPIPQRFDIVIDGQATMFQYYWNRIDDEDRAALERIE